MKAHVVYNRDAELQMLGNGVSRKVLAHSPELMAVEVRFERDGEGSVHAHPHSQITYVQSGRFLFAVDGDHVAVGAGDSICFPSNVPHGVRCLEAGILVDVFTPMREDFITV